MFDRVLLNFDLWSKDRSGLRITIATCTRRTVPIFAGVESGLACIFPHLPPSQIVVEKCRTPNSLRPPNLCPVVPGTQRPVASVRLLESCLTTLAGSLADAGTTAVRPLDIRVGEVVPICLEVSGVNAGHRLCFYQSFVDVEWQSPSHLQLGRGRVTRSSPRSAITLQLASIFGRCSGPDETRRPLSIFVRLSCIWDFRGEHSSTWHFLVPSMNAVYCTLTYFA